MSVNSFNFSGQTADPEIVRENFNKIARWLTNSDATVMRLQSQVADISSLGANATIRNFTVFMQSDTDACEVIIYDPQIFALSVIDRRDTLWFFKGVSGASTKTISVISGTIEGSTSITIANGQTICIQSNGEEYKILFDSAAGGGGSQDLQSVTDIGFTTSNPIISELVVAAISDVNDVAVQAGNPTTNHSIALAVDLADDLPYLRFTGNTFHAGSSNLKQDSTTASMVWQLPNKSGNIPVVNIADDFADDSAAAGGGILVEQCYHTSGAVKIRLT